MQIQITNPIAQTIRTSTQLQVSFSLKGQTSTYLKQVYASLGRQWAETRLDIPFTESEFNEYMLSLISLRVKRLNTSIYKDYHSPDNLLIPDAFFYTALEGIGEVDSSSGAFRYTVADWDIKSLPITSSDKLDKVNWGLQSMMKHMRTEMIRGLPKSKNGLEWFMSSSTKEGIVITGEIPLSDSQLAIASMIEHASGTYPRVYNGLDMDLALKSLISMLP